MHPVLIYGFLFIASSIALLPVFDAFQLGSFKFLLVLSAFFSFAVGKLITSIWPYDDPMKDELALEESVRKGRMYQREIQTLFNIIQPDPRRQPSLRRIQGSLLDNFDLPEVVMKTRLNNYMNKEVDLDVRKPIVELVQQIQRSQPNWPDVSKE